jgi:CubicO group peptidase (beta-lactamase class C family)
MEVQGFTDGRFAPVRQGFAEIIAAQPGTGAGFAVWCEDRLVVDLWGGYADTERCRRWEPGSLVQPYSVSKPFAAVCALLAAQPPAWSPGTAHGESALFYGHLVGELVRRVDGRSVGRFLAEEICGPAGLEFAFGLSRSQQPRAVDLTGLDEKFRAANTAGRPDLYRLAIANPPGAQDGAVVNSAAWRAAEIPAVNGHGTATAVAGFYHALVSGRLLSPGMLAEAVTPQCAGPDQVFGADSAWGLGFGISDDGYGMGGLGGSYGGASTAGGYEVAFVTGSAGNHDRVDTLENTLRECLGLAPIPVAGDPPADS